MSVRARFRVTSNTRFTGQGKEVGTVQVKLNAVTGPANTDDNITWSKYTPAGELTMSITNPDAYEQFEPGQEFYLDFTPVE